MLALLYLLTHSGELALAAELPRPRQEGVERPPATTVAMPAELRSVMAAFGVADIADAATVESSGSGFIVHPDGFILSNHHVVDGADQIDAVLHDGTIHRAKVVEADSYKDLALLKIEAKGLTAAQKALTAFSAAC